LSLVSAAEHIIENNVNRFLYNMTNEVANIRAQLNPAEQQLRTVSKVVVAVVISSNNISLDFVAKSESLCPIDL